MSQTQQKKDNSWSNKTRYFTFYLISSFLWLLLADFLCCQFFSLKSIEKREKKLLFSFVTHNSVTFQKWLFIQACCRTTVLLGTSVLLLLIIPLVTEFKGITCYSVRNVLGSMSHSHFWQDALRSGDLIWSQK